ncbi:nitronate monooxygenase [Phanerochaete sordida]|uniref:Nitronate monooxygenase n=1 Tax=Phanerochaete sordida TaxID=48140 RepID=A0A9P3G251_9APHY|nr:nitronate monooxygenase [Phanerochaete sordida]
MQPISTKITQLLDIQSPILAAPMAFASTADLAAAVTGKGGYGFVGAGFDTSEQLKTTLGSARKTLKIADDAPLPIGVGFLGWICDMTEASEDPRIPTVLEEKVTAVWFAFGNDLLKYINTVREYDAKRAHKTKIFCCCNSVDEALRAANEWKVDVIVAQGVEAGGHGSSHSPPLLNFIPAVKAALPHGPPIVAAGGIATGAQVAGLLTMGADAVVLGTRFLFTPECQYTEQMKNVLVASTWESTERSGAYDQAFQTDFWPAHVDGRAISTNDVMKDFKAGLPLEERINRYKEANAAGSDSHLIMWAGVGVAQTNDIRPAADVFEEIHTDAVKTLQSAPVLLKSVSDRSAAPSPPPARPAARTPSPRRQQRVKLFGCPIF